jgi:hypothetical protein
MSGLPPNKRIRREPKSEDRIQERKSYGRKVVKVPPICRVYGRVGSDDGINPDCPHYSPVIVKDDKTILFCYGFLDGKYKRLGNIAHPNKGVYVFRKNEEKGGAIECILLTKNAIDFMDENATQLAQELLYHFYNLQIINFDHDKWKNIAISYDTPDRQPWNIHMWHQDSFPIEGSVLPEYHTLFESSKSKYTCIAYKGDTAATVVQIPFYKGHERIDISLAAHARFFMCIGQAHAFHASPTEDAVNKASSNESSSQGEEYLERYQITDVTKDCSTLFSTAGDKIVDIAIYPILYMGNTIPKIDVVEFEEWIKTKPASVDPVATRGGTKKKTRKMRLNKTLNKRLKKLLHTKSYKKKKYSYKKK